MYGKEALLMIPSLEELLAGNDDCVAALERLLAAIGEHGLQQDACARLHKLADTLERHPGEVLNLSSVSVPGTDEPIRLLLHPAVFSPEHWGRTFAEGLLKDPARFEGKRVVELGTGSGWISLLLLRRTSVREILALDINPIAVLMAGINAWLNGTDADGRYRLSQA